MEPGGPQGSAGADVLQARVSHVRQQVSCAHAYIHPYVTSDTIQAVLTQTFTYLRIITLLVAVAYHFST